MGVGRGRGGRVRPRKKSALAFAGVLLALVVFPALSGADASEPPAISVDPVTALTSTSATLNGKVTPNDPDNAVGYTFDWGTSTSYTGHEPGTVGPGTSPEAVSAPISSLSPGTSYHYRLCATNAPDPPGGTNCSGDQTLTTLAKPGVSTGGASSVTQTSASLAGAVDPNGDAATWKFYFGTSTSTGTSYPFSSTGGTTGSGTSASPVSDSISGLIANTTYFYRLCAKNSVNPGDPSCGSEQQFTTQDAPTSVAGAASNVTINGATLNGTVNPNGATVSSTVFRYGAGCMPPNWTDNCTLASAAPSPGSGRSPVSVSATLSGLQSGTTFHYTVCATNTYGTTCDTSDHTFTTGQPTISIADAGITEGQIANFVVTLSAVSAQPITVDYTTANGSAVAPGDYTTAAGTLTIPANSCGPGTTNCVISVQTIDDSAFESTETYSVNLTNPVGALISDGVGTGSIFDNDQAPVVIIANTAHNEGHEGSAVTGAQTWAAGGSLSLVDAHGMPNSAQASAPFYLISPGSTQTTPTATGNYRGPFTYSGKNGNTLLNVRPAGSALAGQIAFRPNPYTFTVLLCNAAQSGTDADHCVPTTSGQTTTVDYTTVNGQSDSVPHTPVTSGQDYVSACSIKNAVGAACSGPVLLPITIPAGATQGAVTVSGIPNTVLQNTTRHFTLKLLGANGATVRWGLGAGGIIDDDFTNPPTASTGDALGIGITSATISATANAKGEPATAYIEYGLTAPGYGSTSASQALQPDFADHHITFSVTGLSPGTTYHYRVVATRPNNATGYGEDRTFTTDKPIIIGPPPPPPPPGGPPPPPPPPPPLPVVKVKLVSRALTVTSKGVVWVTLSCKTRVGVKCRGRIDLDLFGTPAGSAPFRLNAGKTARIPIKLKSSTRRALRKSKKKRLALAYTLSFHSAGDMDYNTGTLTVSSPRVRQKQGKQQPHK